MNNGNRALWSIIGLVMLALGVLGVLANRGWLPFADRDEPALTAAAVQRWNGWGGWATAATIAAGLLLAVLGFFLVRAQVRGRGGAAMGDLSMRRDLPRDHAIAPSAEEPSAQEPSAQEPSAEQPTTTPLSEPALRDPPQRKVGRTQVASSALNHALTRDLEGGAQVRRAAVRIVGKPVRPQLLVRLSVTQDADLAGLKRHVDRAVDRFATTSGLSPEVAEVTIKVADREPARVR